jgi:hypothetical protein
MAQEFYIDVVNNGWMQINANRLVMSSVLENYGDMYVDVSELAAIQGKSLFRSRISCLFLLI